MKIVKKISTLFLTLCLTISCFSMVAFAASGRISFTDPETKVGDMVEITCAVRADGTEFDDVEVGVEYDSEYLSFKSGDDVEKDGNNLNLTHTGTATDVTFTMTFQALKEGSTQVTIEGYTIKGTDGSELTFDEGSSSVTIGEGDPSKIEETDDDEEEETSSKSANAGNTLQVEVNGVAYTLTSDFPDKDIPEGYVRCSETLDGVDIDMVTNENSGTVLGYLVDSSNQGDFFLYDTSDAKFWPYEEIYISDSTSIMILSDTSEVSLPEVYQEATLTLNGKEFPVWQDTSADSYYIVLAKSNAGNTGYYRYDTVEGTYQRFDVDEAEDTVGPDTSTPLGRIEDLIQNHLPTFILIVGFILVLLLIILIVVAVKLHNRNVELDDLYDEYGIDMEDEDDYVDPKEEKRREKEQKKQAKQDKKQSKNQPKKQPKGQPQQNKKNKKRGRNKYDDEDDFSTNDDEFTEEFFNDEDLDDGEDTENFDEEDFTEEKFETSDLDEVPVDDDAFEGYSEREELTLDDLWGDDSDKKKKQSHQEDDDEFKVDFIDLD